MHSDIFPIGWPIVFVLKWAPAGGPAVWMIMAAGPAEPGHFYKISLDEEQYSKLSAPTLVVSTCSTFNAIMR